MESDQENLRLDIKTNVAAVKSQALWAGITPGMRIADLGCGPGKTTFTLSQILQPQGSVVGVDNSENRISYATRRYSGKGINYVCRDIRHSLLDLGLFDFIWARFVLEYNRRECFDIVKNITTILKPGGILCLIDLDYNCLTHYGLPPRFERAFLEISKELTNNANFDPYVGRKLYSFLYDLGYADIAVRLTAHHLIYGKLTDTDEFNWTQKIEVAAKKAGYGFDEYPGGYEEFYEEFKRFFSDPRRFTYTPLIECRGRKPLES